MPEADAASALEHYRDAVKRCQEAKAALEAKVAEAAGGPEWAAESDALSLIKGIDTVAAFALAWEAGDFSRFPSAPSFAAWTGLVPSESSSGESSSRGGITRTGNAHVRALPVEAAWHVPMSSRKPKPERPGHEVPAPVGRHALKCNRRLQDRREAMSSSGKRPCVANCGQGDGLLGLGDRAHGAPLMGPRPGAAGFEAVGGHSRSFLGAPRGMSAAKTADMARGPQP